MRASLRAIVFQTGRSCGWLLVRPEAWVAATWHKDYATAWWCDAHIIKSHWMLTWHHDSTDSVWRVMKWWGYKSWVVVRTLFMSVRMLYLMLPVILSQWRECRMGVIKRTWGPWQQQVQENSGFVGGKLFKTWGGCDKENYSNHSSLEWTIEVPMVVAVLEWRLMVQQKMPLNGYKCFEKNLIRESRFKNFGRDCRSLPERWPSPPDTIIRCLSEMPQGQYLTLAFCHTTNHCALFYANKALARLHEVEVRSVCCHYTCTCVARGIGDAWNLMEVRLMLGSQF